MNFGNLGNVIQEDNAVFRLDDLSETDDKVPGDEQQGKSKINIFYAEILMKNDDLRYFSQVNK